MLLKAFLDLGDLPDFFGKSNNISQVTFWVMLQMLVSKLNK